MFNENSGDITISSGGGGGSPYIPYTYKRYPVDNIGVIKNETGACLASERVWGGMNDANPANDTLDWLVLDFQSHDLDTIDGPTLDLNRVRHFISKNTEQSGIGPSGSDVYMGSRVYKINAAFDFTALTAANMPALTLISPYVGGPWPGPSTSPQVMDSMGSEGRTYGPYAMNITMNFGIYMPTQTDLFGIVLKNCVLRNRVGVSSVMSDSKFEFELMNDTVSLLTYIPVD